MALVISASASTVAISISGWRNSLGWWLSCSPSLWMSSVSWEVAREDWGCLLRFTSPVLDDSTVELERCCWCSSGVACLNSLTTFRSRLLSTAHSCGQVCSNGSREPALWPLADRGGWLSGGRKAPLVSWAATSLVAGSMR
jgi:hypothetical protein